MSLVRFVKLLLLDDLRTRFSSRSDDEVRFNKRLLRLCENISSIYATNHSICGKTVN